MKNRVVIAAVALLCGVMASRPARAFTHPCVPLTLEDLATLKASLNRQPWKAGYQCLANSSTSQLSWPMEGPYKTVTRAPDQNLAFWVDDMNAVKNCALMWYFTGNNAYAKKAHDILLAWANTQTTMGGQEAGLLLGDLAESYAGGADILRGTWPGWTAADTAAVKKLFLNVYWPVCSGAGNTPGEFSKGLLNMRAAIMIAAFCDDTAKFNHVIDSYRTYPAAGVLNLLPTGEAGETGRDAGHAYDGVEGAAFICECAWKQGIDLYGELDNRLLAVGEYYVRNTFFADNPFVPYGTIDYTYYDNPGAVGYGSNRASFYLIQNAYKNRKGLPTPWIDFKLRQENVDNNNWLYARAADFSIATPPAAIVRPPVSVASSGLTLMTLGSQTTGHSSSYSNGIWKVAGLGDGTWSDGADDCQFAYQAMTGDCAMVAKVNSATYSGSDNGKVGLMIRDNLVGTVSQRAWIGIVPNPTAPLMESHQRGWTENWAGIGMAQRSNPLPPGMPYWLKIERRGYMITTYSSPDGATWAPIISSYYGNLPPTVYIGLFVCSGNATVTTATFSNVAFTGGSGGLETTPAAPASLFADGSGRAITVRWQPSFGATSYNLLRSTTSGSGYMPLASNLPGSTTSYVDTTAAPGTTYYYVATAANSVGTSEHSPQYSASRLPSPMVNLAFSGTANDSDNDSANTSSKPANAFDEDPASQWFYSKPTGWLQYDFGENNAQIIKRYTLSCPDTLYTRDPKDWTFQGSQDGTNWTTLDTRSGQSFQFIFQQKVYDIPNTTAYRYYRINVTANNGDPTLLHIGELGLWSNVGRTIPDGIYCLSSRKSNKALNADAAGSVRQRSYGGYGNQKWKLKYMGNGQYQILNLAGGKALDVPNRSAANGATLDISSWSGDKSQCWIVTPGTDGFFRLTAAHSGKVASVTSTANGTSVIQWPYVDSPNQEWSISNQP
jgi:hypothetical protein